MHYHSTGPHKLSVSSHRLSQVLAACYVSHGDDHRSPNKKSQKPKKKITKNHKQSQKITKPKKKITKNHKKSQTITKNHKNQKKKSQIITKNHKILFHNVVTFCDFFRKNTTRHFPARPGHPSVFSLLTLLFSVNRASFRRLTTPGCTLRLHPPEWGGAAHPRKVKTRGKPRLKPG